MAALYCAGTGLGDNTGRDDRKPRAAVIGASLAGMKIAPVLHEMGMSVTLVEREPSILPLSAHVECARVLQSHLIQEGYELRLGAALSRVAVVSDGVELDLGALPRTADPGGSGGNACEDGLTQERADLVVCCTGTRPALGLLKPGEVGTGVGVLVDEQLRSSIPTLYAAGDAAQGKNPMSGRHEVIGLWANARHQGRAAGRSMGGTPSRFRGSVPSSITHVGRLLFASIGCVREYDHIEISRRSECFQLRVWQDGRLVGINLIDDFLSAGQVRQGALRATISGTGAKWTSSNVS